MDYLQSLLDSSEIPMVTAFLLGLLTAVSPCPLATNITAMGYISKDISDANRVFRNGVFYTVGRVVAYASLGAVLIAILRAGADTFAVQQTVSEVGEVILAPALILIGVFMLFADRLNLPKFGLNASSWAERLRGAAGCLMLGVLLAMAFCPTSGLLFFGILIPMSAAENGGYMLPVVYAIATGLPVVLAAWVLAYSVAGLGRFYNAMITFQRLFNHIVAVAFIVVGIYYLLQYFGII